MAIQPALRPRPARELIADGRFRRAWGSGVIIGTMRWLEILAIGLYTYDRTGSATLVAVMTFARMFPLVLFGAVAGSIVEHFDRRGLMVAGFALSTLVCAALLALGLSDRLEIWHVGLGAFANGVIWCIEFPVRRNMIGELAGIERAGSAMALDTSTGHLTRVLGPLIGGTLYQSIGLDGVYALSAVAYGFGIPLIATLNYRPGSAQVQPPAFFAGLRDGLAFVRREPTMIGVLSITVLVNMFVFPFASMLPVLGAEWELSASRIGMLAGAEGLGAFAGALLVATYARPTRYRQLFYFGSLAFMILVFAMIRSGAFGPAYAILLIGGLGVSGFAAMQSTLVFLAAPPAMRARALGLLSVCIGAGPLGVLHVGWLADRIGATSALSVMLIEGFVGMLIVALLRPEFLRRTEPDGGTA